MTPTRARAREEEAPPPTGGRARAGKHVRGARGLLLGALLLAAPACREDETGRVLEVLVPALPATLDPFGDPRLVSRSLFTAVYEPLVEQTAFGLRPAIAESWANPSPDAWVFRIAPDSRFHDGSPVTARDVVEAALASRASRRSLSPLADLKTIEVVDERTVRFRTHRPAEDFLLAVSSLAIPRKAGGQFFGTAGFRVATATRHMVVLRRVRRPRHPDPFLEEVRFRALSAPSEAVRLLRERDDLALLAPSREAIAAVRGDRRYRAVATESGGLTYLAVGFSAGAGPLEDVRVRRALRRAIDFPALARAGAVGGGTPAGQLVPPGTFGWDQARKPPARDLPGARRLLADAGFPSGFEAELDVNRNGLPAAEELARQAAEAGIRLRVVVRRPDEFVARIDGQSPLYLYSWYVGDDAGQALRNAFHTRDAARGLGALNRTGYSDAALDRAFDALAAATTSEERLGRLLSISAHLDEELPWIPLFSSREMRILPAWLDLPDRTDGLFVVAEARAAGGGR